MATNKRVHSFTDDILGDLDAVAIAELIRKKEVSALEVTEATISRAERVNPTLKAIVEARYDLGRKQAQEVGEGFFAGVPTFFKDLTLFEGYKTYFGAAAFTDPKPAKKTDGIAKQIMAQGFVKLGTTTLPEFGLACTTEFPHMDPTVNPWNPEHSVGGSSGGSAALVAAGVVPMAHSADGGGSTRIPASCNGLVGLKCTRKRLLKSGLFETAAVDIAEDGMLTRTVRDTAHFYAEAEKYYKNPKLKPIGLVEGPSNRKFKIGFTSESVQDRRADAQVTGVLHDTAKLLESMGHEVKEINLPVKDQFAVDMIDLWAMSAFYLRYFGKLMFGKQYDPKQLTKMTHGLAKFHKGRMHRTPAFVTRLNRTKHNYKKILEELDIDIILTPTLGHAPPKIGYLGMDLDYEEMFPRMVNWATFSPYANAAGAPAISLPLGHDETNDLPIGMMFGAHHGEEALLLDLAYQLEEAKPWKKITD